MLLIVLALIGSHNALAKEYAFVAEHKNGSIGIKIGLIHGHPFLAEYKKFIKIYSWERASKKS